MAERAQSGQPESVSLIAPGGIRAPIEKMIPEFERTSGYTLAPTFGSGRGTKTRVMSGEAFDVPIVQPPLGEVVATGHVVASTETPLAVVHVALAVRKGGSLPDIATPEALKKTLLAARSVAYPDPGRGAAAGVSFDETLRKLGIAEAMQPKLVRAQGGTVAMTLLANGEVEVGLTFLSEIHEPAVEVVGVLPIAISPPTALVGYVSTRARSATAAKVLLAYLSSPQAAEVYRAFGMVPSG